MKKQLLFLLLLWHAGNVLAQSDFRPGYIIPSSGDTLRGFLDYRGEESNGRQCVFRASQEAEKVVYLPAQLQGYGFASGHTYQSRQLKPVSELVFLRALVLGPLSLYTHIVPGGKESFYVVKGSQLPQVLTQTDTTIQVKENGVAKSILQRNYKYRTVLWPLMADCPSAQVAVKDLRFEDNSLVKAVQKYNGCLSGNSQYVAPASVSPKKLMLVAGVQVANTSMKDASQTEQQLEGSWQPVVGLGLQIQPAKFNSRFSVHAQALFTQQKYAKTYDAIAENGAVYTGRPVSREMKVHVVSLRLPLFLRYTTPRGAVRVYAEAGALPVLNLKADASIVSTSKSGTSFVYRETVDMRSYNIGGFLGAGLLIPCGTVGQFHVELRKDRLDRGGDEPGRFSGSKGTSVLVGFTFGK